MKSERAWTSKGKVAAPMICIRPEHVSQNGTSSSAHSGLQRGGMPPEQSSEPVEPQQIGRMSLISLIVPSVQTSWPRAGGVKVPMVKAKMLMMVGVALRGIM